MGDNLMREGEGSASRPRGGSLVGERIMAATGRIANELGKQIDLARLSRDEAYAIALREDLFLPVIQRHAREEKLVIQVYFEIAPEHTPWLGPEDAVEGVIMSDPGKKGDFRPSQMMQLKFFTRDNPYMQWFFQPWDQRQGVWSSVYFDPYVHADIVSYTMPVEAAGQLVGVVGMDVSYKDFRRKISQWLIKEIEAKVEQLRREHAALGQGGRFSNQYLRLDTMEIVDTEQDGEGVAPSSPQMKQVTVMAARAAITQATILILGETGVGKDHLARFIHSKSGVKDGPFVSVNCSAIPESLLESEFFGYEKGAFTGAKTEGKPGFFELAHGGTIFLNEIGEVPLHLQAKFLAVIQEKEITRVGGTKTKAVNFRVVAATNRDLAELVQQGKFREDLFYRLNVVPLVIPPLRERREDLLSMLSFFLNQNIIKYGIAKHFEPGVYEALTSYPWPGNIRELENAVERMYVTSEGSVIALECLPPEIAVGQGGGHSPATCSLEGQSLPSLLAAYEGEIIRRAYAEHGSSYKVAKALGISQTQATRKIRLYVGK